MFKLTAVLAAAAFMTLVPTAEGRPEEVAGTGTESGTRLQCASAPKTVIEDVAPRARPVRPESKPIVLEPRDWPATTSRTPFPSDPQDIAAIPTWPSYYETVTLPSRARYAANYSGEGTRPASTDPNAVNWGPDVVPVVEILPKKK